MKRPLHPPRFLPEVLQAICELKETGGSNSNRIVSHVKSSLNETKSHSTPRNLSTQVQRALRHATTNGIVKQRAGKFRINAAILNPFKDCEECRRRKKKEGKRRRRKRRRRSIGPNLRSHTKYHTDADGYNRYESDSESEDYPVRQLRRRRRKGGNEGKKRRRRRRRRHHDNSLVDPENNDKKRDDETYREDPVYPDDHKEDNMNNRDNHQCDNPECLCNVKDEFNNDQNFEPPM